MKNILRNFRLSREKEEIGNVIANIHKAVPYRGTNLWILVFAIFIASLGLNVNSTAVIIGAMLISPLMGPIIGIGFSVGINDGQLLRKSIFNYFFAAGVGLVTSTVYFLISPLNDAHSEILARVSPNIYDVLIAIFGGFAGILAICSKNKGNVIPGVAIATALMPPLCTAGYGLATFKLSYFFGAFYLFFINTVFIAVATLITVRLLKFPLVHLPHAKDEKRSRMLVWFVVMLTLIPSLYFGYDIVQMNRFENNANKFVENEAFFPNDYLLKKTIDSKEEKIVLVYGGAPIDSLQIDSLKMKLPDYNLPKNALTVQQGFAYLTDNKSSDKGSQVDLALTEKLAQLEFMQRAIDSISVQDQLSTQIFKELQVLYPNINSFALQPARVNTDSLNQKLIIGILQSKRTISSRDKSQIESWLRLRVKDTTVRLYTEKL